MYSHLLEYGINILKPTYSQLISFIALVCESLFTLPIPSSDKGGGGCRELIVNNLSTPHKGRGDTAYILPSPNPTCEITPGLMLLHMHSCKLHIHGIRKLQKPSRACTWKLVHYIRHNKTSQFCYSQIF